MLALRMIYDAAATLGDRVRRTELIPSRYFSERVGTPLWFKCENLQHTGSFKLRGRATTCSTNPPTTSPTG